MCVNFGLDILHTTCNVVYQKYIVRP